MLSSTANRPPGRPHGGHVALEHDHAAESPPRLLERGQGIGEDLGRRAAEEPRGLTRMRRHDARRAGDDAVALQDVGGQRQGVGVEDARQAAAQEQQQLGAPVSGRSPPRSREKGVVALELAPRGGAPAHHHGAVAARHRRVALRGAKSVTSPTRLRAAA